MILNPSAELVRERIQGIQERKVRQPVMYQMLIDGRVSEVVGKYYPKGSDYEVATWKGNPVIIFHVKTAKTEGPKIRYAALPLDPHYEPWAQEMLECFERAGESRVFKIKKRTLQDLVKPYFQGFQYTIEAYGTMKEEAYTKVSEHPRNFLTHGIRHTRAQELMMQYGFDNIDLALFGGWKLAKELRQSAMARYLYSSGSWVRYIGKLFQEKAVLKFT